MLAVRKFAVFFILFITTACSSYSEYKLKNEAWDKLLKNLKSPSTAKMVDCKLEHDLSEYTRKNIYLETDFCFYYLNNMETSLEKGDASLVNLFVLMCSYEDTWDYILSVAKDINPEYVVLLKNKVNEFIADLRDGNGHCDVQYISKDFLDYNIEKIINLAYEHRKKAVLELYEKNSLNFVVCSIIIEYDAQNSYGAMLRDKAYFRAYYSRDGSISAKVL